MFNQWHIELEVTEGLEDISINEIRQLIKQVRPKLSGAGLISLSYDDNLRKLEQLHTVFACYIVLDFAVPRPKALLGHQHFTQIIETCHAVIKTQPFQTVTLNAAGSDSSVMRRILDEISQSTGLTPDVDDGDLLIRIRKSKDIWQVLIRTTPRPLSARKWRLHDYQGALNAPTAYAMNQLISPDHTQQYANFMCGSGTLLIERALSNQECIYGFDINPQALQFAQDHLRESHINAQLIQSDITQVPLGSDSLSAITADLPFGQLIGSHRENQTLYPQILREMYRVLTKTGIAVIITHEVRLFEKLIHMQDWRVHQIRKINLRGLHPRIYVLEKQ